MTGVQPKRRRRGDKIARVELIPDHVWARASRFCNGFVLHHTACEVMVDRPCDCRPLIVGQLFAQSAGLALA